jgi:menaquinone-specific isochorismate synthase
MSPTTPAEAQTLFRAQRQLTGSPAAAPDPAAFLARFEGGPRGFWGRGDRWAAWAGVLEEIRVDGGEAPPSHASGRFERVREAVARWAVAEGGGPRLFGGFSFLDTPAPNGSWSGFPAARFLLPRVLLESGPEGTRVVVHALGSSDAEGAEAEADALAELMALDAGDAGPGASGSLHPDPPPAPGERAEERGEVAWTGAVEAVLAAVAQGRVEKAVLARTRDVHFQEAVPVPALLRFLRYENRRAHVFVFEPDPGRILFGAAPEVLAELRDGRFHATAVAGSAPRGRTSHEDQLLEGGLLASPKDRAEHRMTVEAMAEVMGSRSSDLVVPVDPRVLKLARIQHLESPLDGRVSPDQGILELVEALHPTPAVCGRPRPEALGLIREAEPFERGWYAGPVGWLDPAGNGDFVPALRVGVGGGARWRLYAGAGIVEGSDPHSEWEETALKFEPAHRALRAAAGALRGAGET